MVALWNRADHYIFMLWFVLLVLLSFLRCRSEMCCTRLAEIQDEKTRQKIAFWPSSHNFVGLYLRNEGMYRQSEKNLLNSNSSSTCPDNIVNFGLLTAEICWRVWGTPANFNGFRVLAELLHSTLVVGVSQNLWR